jgi:hypothetical protein
MLNALRWVALVSAVVLFATGCAVVYFSSELPQTAKEQQTTEKHDQEPPKGQNPKLLWDRVFPDTIFFFTFWLGLFTGALALVAFLQLSSLNRAEFIAAKTAQAAKESADIAKETLVSTNRAFVFLTTFEANVLGDKLVVAPKFENSGSTPTQNMRSRIAWKFLPWEPPPEYGYPDFDASGNVETSPETRPAFVGPKATSYGPTIYIPIDRLKAGGERIFIWGWMEYNDTLKGTSRYRTEFCNEMAVINLGPGDTNPQAIKAAISFPMYGPHNSAN